MNYAAQYLRSAETICKLYDGAQPLGGFLKNYFKQHTKFGSRDRKRIAQLCYCYYRLGHAVKDFAFSERTRIAVFLCEPEPGVWAELFESEWLTAWANPLNDKISFLQKSYPSFNPEDIFPWLDQLSAGIDPGTFQLSHLIQPNLFLRIRPGKEEKVRTVLKDADLPVTVISGTCVALPNATKVDELLPSDRDTVVQDYSSQRIAEFLPEGEGLTVWDCCAASGGKSILVYDSIPKVKLTATDVRPAIIANLRKRLTAAGVPLVESLIHDVAASYPWTDGRSFDLVLCDAPCSGSGTWSRTPEQLYYFTDEKIEYYTSLQKRIIDQAVKGLRAGSFFLYITCSVFKSENESMVAYLSAHRGLEVVKAGVLDGVAFRADSMYAALLKNNL